MHMFGLLIGWPHMVLLRVISALCLGHYVQCLGPNPGQPCAMQMPYPLYSFPVLKKLIFIKMYLNYVLV